MQSELKTFKDRCLIVEKELETAKQSQKTTLLRKESILNYGNSCPDSSQTDKSGSEISKKLIMIKRPFVESQSKEDVRNHSHSIHSGRYKQVA